MGCLTVNYYLGFDGGGSKTECVVLDEADRVVAQAFAGPSNPLRVGLDRAAAELTSAAATALAGADLRAHHLRAVCAGLAGAGRPNMAWSVLSFLKETFPASFVHAATDLEVALEAAVGAGPGVVLIAGTGSSAYGRNAAAEVARAGGHGPWLGDQGSAFDIGRRAVAAVASARDLGAALPRLGERIQQALEISAWDEVIDRIAQNPGAVFPPLFPIVVEAAEAGDNVARDILASAAVVLADLAIVVMRRLGLQQTEFALAKSGGVFGRSALLDAPLDAALEQFAPRAEVFLLKVSPAVGAARLARRLADLQASGAAHDAEE